MALPSRAKLRLFLVRETSGQPISGLVVEAWATVAPIEHQPVREKPVFPQLAIKALAVTDKSAPPPTVVNCGLLQTDHAGYVSFDLDDSLGDAAPRSLSVNVPGVSGFPLNVLSRWLESDGRRAVTLRVPEETVVSPVSKRLPSVQNADSADWSVSPQSFAAQTFVIVGQDGCERMLISQAPVHLFRFTQILREPADDSLLVEAAPPSPCEVDQQKLPLPPICYRRGALVEYETSWIPAGHGLGEVLYSLPLAPCESVKLAIIEWSRVDTATRTDEVAATEQLIHDQRRDRAIEEIARGTISEWQRGGAVMGAAAGTYNYGSGSIAASLGASYSTSAGDRNATADSVQRLSDAIAQATSNARRLQSTVIVQASQQEAERLQTRTVTNNNHCHALTVLYYEIVRHFRVRTEVSLVQDALLVRHPEQAFDRARATRERRVLEPALRERSLAAGFAALDRLALGAAAGMTGRPRFGNVHTLLLKIRTGEDWPAGGVNERLRDRHELLLLLATGEIRRFRLGDFMIDSARANDDFLFRARQLNTFRMSGLDVPLHQIRQVGMHFKFDHIPGRWSLRGLELHASATVDDGSGARDELHEVYRNPEIDAFFEDDGEWWDDARLDSADSNHGTSEGPADHQLERRLLEHLNAERAYYNRLVWLAEDPDRRAMLFERYRFEHGGRSGRLIDFIENRAADVVGEYVVFPAGTRGTSGRLVPTLPAPAERILSVPTRGAFAEAMLSNCNACEQIDDTRFWDWQQSPCPCEGPGIADIAAGSRARDADVTPTGVPGSTVGVEGPQAAPDPTGLANMLELLGRSDVFRDMSGRAELAGVMQSLVNGAVQLSIEQMRQRAQAQQREQGAASGATGATGAAGGAGGARPSGAGSTSDPNRERDRAFRQANNAVDRAERQGAYTPQEAQLRRRELADGQVRSTVTNPTGAPPPVSAPAAGATPSGTGTGGDGVTATAEPVPQGDRTEVSATTPGSGGSLPGADLPAAIEDALLRRVDLARFQAQAGGWWVEFTTDFVRPYGEGQFILASVIALAQRLFGGVPAEDVVRACHELAAQGHLRSAGVLDPSARVWRLWVDFEGAELLRQRLGAGYRREVDAEVEGVYYNRFLARGLRYALANADEIAVRFSSADLERAGVNGDWIFSQIGDDVSRRWAAAVVEHLPSAHPLRGLYDDYRAANPDYREREIPNGLFAAIPYATWATILTEMGRIIRNVEVREQTAARRAEYSEVHRPRLVETIAPADLIRYIFRRFNPNGICRINLAGPVDIRGGQFLTGTGGHRIFILDAYPGGVLFQDEYSGLFYTQTAEGIQGDLIAGALAQGARTAREGIRATEFVVDLVGIIFPEAGAVIFAARVLRVGLILASHERELTEAYQSLQESYAWFERTYPGFARHVLDSTLRRIRENVDLVEVQFAPDFASWLRLAYRIVFTALRLSSTTGALSAAWQLVSNEVLAAVDVLRNLDLGLDEAAFRSRAEAELQRALERANIADAARWALVLARTPRNQLQQTVRELQMIAASYAQLARVARALAEE